MTNWQLSNIDDILKEPVIDSLKDAFKRRQKQTKIIIIEGSCGAGKSTLVQLMKEYFEYKGEDIEIMNESFIINDPQGRIIEYGNNLKKLYDNEITKEQMTQQAIKLETWIRDQWMKQIHEFIIKEQKPDILLVDRNLYSTIIFMELMNKEGIYPEKDIQITTKNYKFWEFWKRESKIIYWKTPIEESIKRLISRGRSGEQNINYYQKLDEIYNEYILDIYPNIEVITRETLLTKEQLKEVLPKILKEY